jgi:phospholipid/cholesterol/gamma-HCH transport system substrate-binding protein
MKWERSDFVVGVVVVAASLALVGSFLWLSPAISRHAYPVYTEFDRIDGIAKHAHVVMRGYNVGSVAAIEPHMNPQEGLRFRVRLNIHARLASGDSLRIPAGTIARLMPPPVIGAGFIVLEPPRGGGPPLAAGAVIPGVRTEAIVEQMQGLTTNLGDDVLTTMLTARTLMDSMTTAMGHANIALAQATSALPALLEGLQRQLAATEALTADLHMQVAGLTPAAMATIDSAAALMGDSRRLVQELNETLLIAAPDIHEILANLDTTTILFNHFIRQVTERPWRMFTGVRPPAGLSPPPPGPTVEPADTAAREGETRQPPGP